jgi:hypothetical protein
MTDFVEGIAHNMCTFSHVQRRKKREQADATHDANAETQRLETVQTLSLPYNTDKTRISFSHEFIVFIIIFILGLFDIFYKITPSDS